MRKAKVSRAACTGRVWTGIMADSRSRAHSYWQEEQVRAESRQVWTPAREGLVCQRPEALLPPGFPVRCRRAAGRVGGRRPGGGGGGEDWRIERRRGRRRRRPRRRGRGRRRSDCGAVSGGLCSWCSSARLIRRGRARVGQQIRLVVCRRLRHARWALCAPSTFPQSVDRLVRNGTECFPGRGGGHAVG